MQIYLAAAPDEAREAARFRRPLAHRAYRIGPESTLLRRNLLLGTQGGLLAVTDQDAPPVSRPEELAAAAVRECGRRSYNGVLLELTQPPGPDRLALAEALARALAPRPLYVPESCSSVPGTVPLISTALSGGNFTQRLREAAAAGAGRLALDVERLRMDFPLPSPSGEGRPLSGRELRDLLDREAPAVFFSQDLCARYFTYTREGETHFVLFDDADTLQQKLRTGSSLGFSAAFLLFPEVRDLLPRLFPSRRN